MRLQGRRDRLATAIECKSSILNCVKCISSEGVDLLESQGRVVDCQKI